LLVITSDTREQLELDFSGINGVDKVEKVGMAFGDYGCVLNDKVVPIVIDRKNLSDLFGTMTSGYDRWKKLMARAKEANFKLILAVEGTYSDVWTGVVYSKFSGESMIKKLAMLYVRYDLDCWFCESRRVMARRIVDLFAAVDRNYSKENSKTIANLGASSAIRPSTFGAQSITSEHDE